MDIQVEFSSSSLLKLFNNYFRQVGAADAFIYDELCTEREIEEFSEEEPYVITTLIMLFVVQFAIGLGNVAFYCLGLSYMDDNINEHDSPAFLGAALAARLWGPQLGSGIAFFVEALPLGWWLGWAMLCPFIFTIGLVITLFPRRLLKTAVELAANRILETVTSGTQSFAAQSRFLADISFIASVRRLFTNKLLLFNVVALMLLQTGIYNFMALEESYLQARFFLPTSEADGLYDEWTSRYHFLTYATASWIISARCGVDYCQGQSVGTVSIRARTRSRLRWV